MATIDYQNFPGASDYQNFPDAIDYQKFSHTQRL